MLRKQLKHILHEILPKSKTLEPDSIDVHIDYQVSFGLTQNGPSILNVEMSFIERVFHFTFEPKSFD